ncbi:MAG: ABC transporter ATP-binding protein [Thermotogaceae bacterium]|nr:ABC transporter ATP-binding protein [Thermotogaceae bacterium]
MNDSKILRIENLSAVYLVREGSIKAAVDINLDMEEGTITAIVGESASGKSTILEAMTRSLPPNGRIIGGNVYYRRDNGDYVNLMEIKEEELRKLRWSEIALVPQAAQNALNPTIRIFDHFVDTVEDHGYNWKIKEIWDKASNLLDMIGLDGNRVLRSFPHELSGGMRQRTLIALSLLFDPRILILDEPTSALDVLTQARLIRVLDEIHSKLKITMIFVTHDLPVAAELADYMGVIYGGNLMERGRTEDVIGDPKHPYTKALVSSLMSVVGSIEKIKPIPGEPPSLLNPPKGCVFHPRCPFKMDRCSKESPPLFKIDEDHYVRCWLYEE